jgi:DNA-binding GntR family transcriptional regulator
LYVADVTLADLEQLSEMRLALEALSAKLAAQRAAADDLAVLDALCAAQKTTDAAELFALDHKFHQAIAQAAHNKYLAQTLDRFFGLSQRLWVLALPHLDFLPAAVGEHLNLAAAIREGDDGRAAQIMRHHVQDFYDKVRQILSD